VYILEQRHIVKIIHIMYEVYEETTRLWEINCSMQLTHLTVIVVCCNSSKALTQFISKPFLFESIRIQLSGTAVQQYPVLRFGVVTFYWPFGDTAFSFLKVWKCITDKASTRRMRVVALFTTNNLIYWHILWKLRVNIINSLKVSL
jgi:hypothetical protein